MLTDFNYRNDHNLKISHSSPPDSWPVGYIFHFGAIKRYLWGLALIAYAPLPSPLKKRSLKLARRAISRWTPLCVSGSARSADRRPFREILILILTGRVLKQSVFFTRRWTIKHVLSPDNQRKSCFRYAAFARHAAWSRLASVIRRKQQDISYLLHCVSKKFPPLYSLQLCQILTDFQNSCTAGKRMKFATKSWGHNDNDLGRLLHYLGKLKIQFFLRLRFDKATESSKVGTFLRHSVYSGTLQWRWR